MSCRLAGRAFQAARPAQLKGRSPSLVRVVCLTYLAVLDEYIVSHCSVHSSGLCQHLQTHTYARSTAVAKTADPTALSRIADG